MSKREEALYKRENYRRRVCDIGSVCEFLSPIIDDAQRTISEAYEWLISIIGDAFIAYYYWRL